ncbi:MAG TPA: tetratricopeptide repeat protein [Gemmataceae bacterium]|nr:tetratricopeptide repeat protein [Gemmataceae bacterium]
MRTLRTEFRWATIALTVLGCLSPAFVRAEERGANLRRQILKLNEITGKDPMSSEAKALLKDKDAAKKLVSEAARMAADKPQLFTYNATLILGTVASGVKNYGAADTFYRGHLEQAKQLRSTQGLLAAYGGLITSAYSNRKYAEAEKWCEEVRKSEIIAATVENLSLEKDEDAGKELKTIQRFISGVLEEQIMAIAQQGDADRAVDIIDRLLKDKSDGWLAMDLKGRAYRVAGKYKESVKAYKAEMERLNEDNDLKKKDKEELVNDVRYSLSGVYIELGQVEKAAEHLKALLAKSPDNPTYNNDLGYIWADHDLNLSEAEKLIRKAIKDDRKQRQKANPKAKPEEIKDRGAYLDSLGWVLYKQGLYSEAKKYLQQAVQNTIEEDELESIEILDHLGDVLMALGEKAEAVAVWKKGLAVAGESKREQKRKKEVQAKIKANK